MKTFRKKQRLNFWSNKKTSLTSQTFGWKLSLHSAELHQHCVAAIRKIPDEVDAICCRCHTAVGVWSHWAVMTDTLIWWECTTHTLQQQVMDTTRCVRCRPSEVFVSVLLNVAPRWAHRHGVAYTHYIKWFYHHGCDFTSQVASQTELEPNFKAKRGESATRHNSQRRRAGMWTGQKSLCISPVASVLYCWGSRATL